MQLFTYKENARNLHFSGTRKCKLIGYNQKKKSRASQPGSPNTNVLSFKSPFITLISDQAVLDDFFDFVDDDVRISMSHYKSFG